MANGIQPSVKISGYLEKKAKLRIGSPWKKYWFVLEGRLLLYYRSKDEYETLSPCKGSINLCPPCNVKPALSAACVFQIECRASTVTLRAENRSEQQRWMQALVGAIAQSKSSPNRMSHFRYSLDDLPVSTAETQKTENPLSRQNSMPYRSSESPKKDIIERLQQMGAHTYGGSLGAITKRANKEQQAENVKFADGRSASSLDISQDKTFTAGDDTSNHALKSPTDRHNAKLSHKSQSAERIQSMFVENDQYSTIQEENSIDMFLHDQVTPPKSDDTKNVIIDNDQYVSEDVIKALSDSPNESNLEKTETRRSFILENNQYSESKEETYFIRNTEVRKIEHLYERISTDSNTSEFNRELRSFCKMQQNATNLYERISSSSSNSDTHTLINNNQYCAINKEGKRTPKDSFKLHNTTNDNQENEYSLPLNSKDETTDHNKNSLLIDNDHYIPTADDQSNENLYSNGLIYTPEYIEYAAIDKTKEQEELYEDPDRLKKHQKERQSALYQDIEPILPPRPDSKKVESSEETSSQTSNEGKKIKKSRFKMLAQLVRSEKKSDSKNERGKPKSKSRQTSFIRKVWRRKTKSLDADDDITYETVDEEFVEKQIGKDKNDVQMLQELQKILEARKNMLQEKLNEKKLDGSTLQSPDSKVQSIAEEREEASLEIRTVDSLNEDRPSLPPRQSSQFLSPTHDVPLDNIPVIESTDHIKLTESSATNSNDDPDSICNNDQSDATIKTIDEILEDLDKQESKQKVKLLIEKFNDIQNEDEVVLRKKTKFILFKSQSDTTVLHKINRDSLNDTSRESDELTMLLEELSKVTCAPVLTPGVTSSLVTPVLTDDEWLQLIPIRRRRMSDPDYDVPRPHRSLQLHGRNKQLPDNPIPATRFFGPILPLSSTNDNVVTSTDLPSLSSMDPDSLELEHLSSISNKDAHSLQQTICSPSNTEKDCNIPSYTSHIYPKDEKVIYANPKRIMLSTKFNIPDNIYSNISMNSPRKNNTKVKESIDKIEVNVRTIEINENLLPIMSKSEEMFIDSLEPLTEISTAF